MVRERRTCAGVVEGEGHVPHLGEPLRAALLVVIEAVAFMSDQHRRTRVVPLRESQTTDQGGTVGGIVEVLDLDHSPVLPPGSSPHVVYRRERPDIITYATAGRGGRLRHARGYAPPRIHRRGWLARHASPVSGVGARPRELQSPSAAAGLRREFSPARPPGLGGGHCALGLVDAVAHEPRGGSPVQGYKD